jgi:hypothetical protein
MVTSGVHYAVGTGFLITLHEIYDLKIKKKIIVLRDYNMSTAYKDYIFLACDGVSLGD